MNRHTRATGTPGQKLLFIVLFGVLGLPVMLVGMLWQVVCIAWETGKYHAEKAFDAVRPTR